MIKWQNTKVKDVCQQVMSGGTPLRSKPEYYENGQIPWLKTGEVKQGYIYQTSEKITALGLANSSAKLIPANSVIVAMYGDGDTAGTVGINKVELATNQACCNLIVDNRVIDYRYLYFYLKGNYNNLVNLKLGSSQQNLNGQTIKNFDILLPPLQTQRKIAAILSAYDDLIENNNKRIALLERAAEDIYREWFVRLRFPGHEGVRFVKGIPEGWELKRFRDELNFKTGKLNSNAAMDDGKYPFFTCSNQNFLTNTFSFDLEAVLLAGNNAAGVYPLKYFNGKFDAYQRTYVVTPQSQNLSVKFVFFMLYDLLVHLQSISIGAATQFLTMKMLNGLTFLKPKDEQLIRFESNVAPMFVQISQLKSTTTILKKSRDLLLSRLISGKLAVDDLDIRFPAGMGNGTTTD